MTLNSHIRSFTRGPVKLFLAVLLSGLIVLFGLRVAWYYNNSVKLQAIIDSTRAGMTRDEVINIVHGHRLKCAYMDARGLTVIAANGPLNAIIVNYSFDTSGTLTSRQVSDVDSLILPYFPVDERDRI